MSGYTPVFRSVFQGSLCGKYPDLPVWLVLLAMADKHGEVDAHPSYIATVSGIPQEDIVAAITRFCQADETSRTPDDDGRRLEPIPNRGFGWTIINHGKYREKARLAAKSEREVESGRNAARCAERRKDEQTADDRRRPPMTAADPLSDSDSDADTDSKKNHPSGDRARKRAARKCPEDFAITPELRAWASEKAPGVDIDRATEAFRDHTYPRTITDWPGAWRNWIRREKPMNGHHARPTRYDELRARSRAKAELPREPTALTKMLIEAKL